MTKRSDRSQLESNGGGDRDDEAIVEGRRCGIYSGPNYCRNASTTSCAFHQSDNVCESAARPTVVLKKLEEAPMDRNSSHVKDLCFEFAQWIMQGGIQEQYVFIDAADLYLLYRRTHGRTRCGEGAVRIVNVCRGMQFTTTFAVGATAGLMTSASVQ